MTSANTCNASPARQDLRVVLRVLAALALLAGLLAAQAIRVKANTIPTVSIVKVVEDESVTLRTHNFPANQEFTVRMGEYGTKAAGGIVVEKTDSGKGGSFEVTYSIPEDLKGQKYIAVRLESAVGYYAYNWFVNRTATGDISYTEGGTGGPYPTPSASYSGVPTISILSVVKDDKVVIKTHNFPADLDFTVRMGEYGTKAVGGIVVATTRSTGGSFEITYSIPEELHGKSSIAIRLESAVGYYAYNWFVNTTATGDISYTEGGTGGPYPTPSASYSGIPTISILSVVKDDKVVIKTHNFPADLDFTVRMGEYGTKGVDGIVVATTRSTGGSFEITYSIPEELYGKSRIAIRLESSLGYYAYNWFNHP